MINKYNMNQQKQNILIVETKNGAKYQGIYVSKDIKKQIITLADVKKTFQGKEESLPNIEIAKENIEGIKILDFKPPKEDIHNFNEIPENKKNVVDKNKLANIEKAYDKSKDGFFDHLKPMTNPEAKKESINYNKKNKDTFNLSENDYDDNQRGWKNHGNRRGYGKGGYGRGNRGGYNKNYYKNNSGRNNNNYGSNGNKNYKGQNYRGHGNRDRGRGRSRGNRGGYKKNNYEQENNLNNNANSQEENNKVDNKP